jgi:hypothetical protein
LKKNEEEEEVPVPVVVKRQYLDKTLSSSLTFKKRFIQKNIQYKSAIVIHKIKSNSKISN